VEVAEYAAELRVEGERLGSAAASAGLEAPVPTCPGWVVRDLVRHVGGVHRWATDIVATPRTEPWDVELDVVVGAWPADQELLDWFAQGHAALLAALMHADPQLACWTFLAAPSPLAMWARRQAHETAMHRVDAELARGAAVTPFSAGFADDGIDELLTRFITRQGQRLRSDAPRSLHIRCLDRPGGWYLLIGPGSVETRRDMHEADCHVIGPASDVYLALWSRQSVDGLTVTGDRGVLDLFLDRVHVRW